MQLSTIKIRLLCALNLVVEFFLPGYSCYLIILQTFLLHKPLKHNFLERNIMSSENLQLFTHSYDYTFIISLRKLPTRLYKFALPCKVKSNI